MGPEQGFEDDCIWSGWGEVHFLFAALPVVSLALITRKVLITHQCFSYCWAVLAQYQHSFSKFPSPHQGAGGKQDPGKGHNQASWPKLSKGVFHAIWLGCRRYGKEDEGEAFIMHNICLLEKLLHVLRPCFPGSQTWLANGKFYRFKEFWHSPLKVKNLLGKKLTKKSPHTNTGGVEWVQMFWLRNRILRSKPISRYS